MNYRERVIRTMQFKDVDMLPFRHAYGLMPGGLEDWHAQGLPVEVQTEKDIYAFFGFPQRERYGGQPALSGLTGPQRYAGS